jgi:DNA-binding LacI/PurR family transcriptional regulator
VLLTGYDNYWRDCQERQFEPAIPAATIDKNHVQLAADLVRLLKERSEGKLPDAPQTRCLSPKLIVSDMS